ncbi:MAG: hypothetical protein WBL85_07235 [Sedimentisphaerales bacterium]
MMSYSCRYFRARKRNNAIETDGLQSCVLGNKLSSDNSADFNGVFVEWKWDGTCLNISNDYCGYYPLFYYADKEQIIVSDSIVKLIALGVPTEYNREALSVFCRCGFFLSDDTPFRQIHTLPPNAALTWQNGNMSVKSQRRINKAADLTTEQAVEGYIEFFRQSMAKYQPYNEQFALPLSGGRDSRQILLELWRTKKLPKMLVTCGDKRDIDVAKIFAERLKIKHQILSGKGKWTDYVLRKNIATHFCALEHAWLMELGDYLSATTEEFYEGTGVGALARGDLFTPENVALYKANRLRDIANWVFDKFGPPTEFFDCLPEEFNFLGRTRDISVELFANELGTLLTAANPLTAMSFWNWGRRAIALWPFGIASRIKRVNTPYLDRNLYDFVSSFAPELVLRQEPQAAAIKKAFPEFADVPFYNELPKSISKKRSLIKRLANYSNKLLTIARLCPSHLPLLYTIKENSLLSKRNIGMQETVLFYLSQLKYCSSKENAERTLAEYSTVYNKRKNIYH